MDSKSNEIIQKTESPHPRYVEAREKAYQLETTIESAQKEYGQQLAKIIKKLQQKFYNQYGDKIQELEDLEDAISHIQYKGMKNLKRELTQLYLESGDDEQTGGGHSVLRQKTKELCEIYRQKYMPKDNYQKKRDEEARKLQMSIMGGMRGLTMNGSWENNSENKSPAVLHILNESNNNHSDLI